MAIEQSTEEWRICPSFPGFSVSNTGRVRSNKTQTVFTGSLNRKGYRVVCLSLGHRGTHKTVVVHRMIAEAFIGHIPPLMQINHKNGIKDDNRIENLEIVTASQNICHARDFLGWRAPVGEHCGKSILTTEQVLEARRRRADGETYQAIADSLKVTRQAIWHIVKRKNWKHLY